MPTTIKRITLHRSKKEVDVLEILEQRNVVAQKAKHSKKDYKHRAKLLFNKIILTIDF